MDEGRSNKCNNNLANYVCDCVYYKTNNQGMSCRLYVGGWKKNPKCSFETLTL
jgi:hypothetical protein